MLKHLLRVLVSCFISVAAVVCICVLPWCVGYVMVAVYGLPAVPCATVIASLWMTGLVGILLLIGFFLLVRVVHRGLWE